MSLYLVSTSRYKALKVRHARVLLETAYVENRGQSKGHTKLKYISKRVHKSLSLVSR